MIDKFGFGFMVAQICHASVAPVTNAIKDLSFYDKTNCQSISGVPYKGYEIKGIVDKALYDWCIGRFTKYVYQVPHLNAMLDLCERLEQDGISFHKITELLNKDESKVGQLTCIGLKPYDKGRVAGYFKNLHLLT